MAATVHAGGGSQQGADAVPMYLHAVAPAPRKLSWGASPSSRPRTAQPERPASQPARGQPDPLTTGSNSKEVHTGGEDRRVQQDHTTKREYAVVDSSPHPPAGGVEAARKLALREVLSFVLGESGSRLDHFQMTPQVSVDGWLRMVGCASGIATYQATQLTPLSTYTGCCSID